MGIEPTHKGFADLSLTTWVPRLDTSNLPRSDKEIQRLRPMRLLEAVATIESCRLFASTLSESNPVGSLKRGRGAGGRSRDYRARAYSYSWS